jgi:signal transduction histidine kinase
VIDESVGINAVVAVAFPVAGALVASRRPHNAVGWIFCAIGLFEGASFFAGEYGRYFLRTEPGSLPAGHAAIWIGTWAWLPGVGLTTTFLLLLFPDGRLPSRRWRPVAWLGALGISLGSVVVAVLPWDLLGVPAENPFGVEVVSGIEVVLAISSSALWAVSTLLSLSALAVRFRRSRGEERQQLKWFVYAGSMTVALFFVPLIPPLADIGTALQILTAPFLPAAVSIAILKYRLYDIDIVINRTLVYGALTACVVGIYVLVIGYLGALFQVLGNLAVSLAATGIVAVLFAPLRDRLQRSVNRLMYGERDEPYKVISRLGQRLEGALVPDAVLPAIAHTVREALKLPYVGVELRGDTGHYMAVEEGNPMERSLHLPFVYQGETLGRLLVAPRQGTTDFSASELRLLEDLARQTGAAAHAVSLHQRAQRLHAQTVELAEDLRRSNEGLQETRERLVTAREEERRRLRRDLHDGLGPQLAALTLKLETARNRLGNEPLADALLSDLTQRTQAAVTDVRRLVYALRPPALDELGLLSALSEQAAQYSQDALSVTLDAPEKLPLLPAAVEVAAYRITQEALTNVVRHARATACVLRLSFDERAGMLCVEVWDNGRGLGPGRGRGVGLQSMRERAEELGGSCGVENLSAGGVRVRAVLPCRGCANARAEQEGR